MWTLGLSSASLTGSPRGIRSAADIFFVKEWEGCTAHLHRNVILLLRALFKCVQCFFMAVFLAFSMWPCGISTVAPRLSVCLLWTEGVDIRVGSTFLSRTASHELFTLHIKSQRQ